MVPRMGGRGCRVPLFGTSSTQQIKKTRGVSQCGLAIYIKTYLKAKEEL
jgi:hypothetical protein